MKTKSGLSLLELVLVAGLASLFTMAAPYLIKRFVSGRNTVGRAMPVLACQLNPAPAIPPALVPYNALLHHWMSAIGGPMPLPPIAMKQVLLGISTTYGIPMPKYQTGKPLNIEWGLSAQYGPHAKSANNGSAVIEGGLFVWGRGWYPTPGTWENWYAYYRNDGTVIHLLTDRKDANGQTVATTVHNYLWYLPSGAQPHPDECRAELLTVVRDQAPRTRDFAVRVMVNGELQANALQAVACKQTRGTASVSSLEPDCTRGKFTWSKRGSQSYELDLPARYDLFNPAEPTIATVDGAPLVELFSAVSPAR